MSTQGPGRKRIPNREKLTGQEDALSQIAREAEARLAAKRVARAEAREFRMKELERLQLVYSHKKYYGLDYKWGHIEQWMEDSERYSGLSRRHPSISDDEERMSVGSRGSLRVEERVDREFIDKSQGSRAASTLSTTTLASLGAASLGGASSRRGSCDTSFSVETEASIREMKDSLLETEEKYRRAMVTNAQLHNDKTALMFQVETLREELGDLEELLWESRRCCDLSNKELELERQAHKALQVQFTVTRETLRQTKELLMNHGISPDLINKDAELNEEDVNAESVSRLAEESPQGSKESIIGRTESRRPAEGNKNLQDLLEQSRISNTITTSNQTGQATERVNTSDQNEPISAQPEQKTAPFVPKEIWIGLDRTVQGKPHVVAEISRIFSDILMSLHRWTSDLENTLKNVENESGLLTGDDQRSTRHERKTRQPEKGKLNLMDLTEQRGTPESPRGSPTEPPASRVSSRSESMGELSAVKSNAQTILSQADPEMDDGSSSKRESVVGPDGEWLDQSESPVKASSEEVVFIDSHFAEPPNPVIESKSDPNFSDSSAKKPESHPGSLGKEVRRSLTTSANSNNGQSSTVMKLLEVTAEELRAIAVPELALLSLQEGRPVDVCPCSKAVSADEVSSRDMDSCEEAAEGDSDTNPASELTRIHIGGLVGDKDVLPPGKNHEEVHLYSRKEQNSADCRVS
ncbi:leucine-rich repeat flightless-interacting protein 1 isoform X2 [Nothobranchius furzeri]|uniref:leucine-rich repeat flightless-interacting protein 1 isoform X2 n=1 Tax=Nothobranchius furzeri TaxID=105023 RepID=UPI003904CF14